MTLTLDDATHATNPGDVTLRPGVWLRHFPAQTLARPAVLLLCVGVAWFTPCFWAAAVLALVDLVRDAARVREHFRHGNVNPGVVIAVDPVRIAVTTDLSWTERDVPAVKVVAAPLRRVDGRPPRVGDRLGTVALYDQRRDLRTRWADFHPLPVACATDDPATIARVLASIPDEEWALLDRVCAPLPADARPGLYLLGDDGRLRPA